MAMAFSADKASCASPADAELHLKLHKVVLQARVGKLDCEVVDLDISHDEV